MAVVRGHALVAATMAVTRAGQRDSGRCRALVCVELAPQPVVLEGGRVVYKRLGREQLSCSACSRH